MAPLPPAEIDNRLAIGGEDIAARKIHGRMAVEVRVNGRGPYRFLVDSGADTSVVGVQIARSLRLPAGSPVMLNAMGARRLIERVKVESLSFGPSTIANLHVPALREENIGGDGIIGIDALVKQRLMMDFERRVIKVEDARVREPRQPNEIVIVAQRRRGQLILTSVLIGGVSLKAIIDTGSEMTIGNLALRNRLRREAVVPIERVSGTDVAGGRIDLDLAQVSELRLGALTFSNAPVAFGDVPPFTIFGLSKEPALLLGTDVLEAFRRVSLDFRTRKVRFQLRSCQTSGFMVNTSPLTRLSKLDPGGDRTNCER